MRLKKVFYLLAIILITVSCNRKLKPTASVNEAAKKSRVIKSHVASYADFKTLKARLGVDYEDDKQSRSITMSLRMEKGKHIWMSAAILGYTLAKVHITPDRVQFYEKLNNRYFDGDFRLISDFLGEELDFTQLEKVLMGQAVESLVDYEYEIADNAYAFSMQEGFSKLFKIRPSDFKLEQQAVSKPSENSFLMIKYPEYQKVGKIIIPKKINIDAKRSQRFSMVELEFKRVELDEDLSFPFSIPAGFKKMKL
ncbi:MAG: DUF4292 domain-containing protein [Nonlabens sp.]